MGNSGSKVVKNASWIIACKIVQAILGLVVSALSARYLGPSNFGIINYAASIVAFALPIMQLGLQCTMVKELVDNPSKEGTIIGTTLLMTEISAFCCVLGILSFSFILNADERIAIVVCALYSAVLFFNSLELIAYWFQAHYLSKYVSITSLCAYFVISAYKIFLLATGKSIHWFAVSNSLDRCLISITLLIIYKRLGGQKLRISFPEGRRMLQRSWTYIISGLMAAVYAQTDRIMLKNLTSDSVTGYYSAAITCAGYISFVFSAIVESMRPYIFEAKRLDEEEYKNRVRKLYSITVYFSLLYSAFCFAFSDLIIQILYGTDYLPAINIYRVIIWYTAFNFYGGAQCVWMLAEEKQKYLILLGTAGAVLNVILNSILIPYYQGFGAAIATLVTAVITNVLLCAMVRPLRGTIKLLIGSLNPGIIIQLIKEAIRSFKTAG